MLHKKEQMQAIENINKTLIVGAGPSGMICALSLARSGKPVEIIDKHSVRDSISKATGVSLGTIKALIELGLHDTITDLMTPMSRFLFYENNKIISDLKIPLLNDEPPAYLYPQLKLEKLIEKELNSKGVFIHYGTSIHSIDNHKSFANVELKYPDGELSKNKFKRIIGADGAHSSVRKLAKFQFEGKVYPEIWSVAEIETKEWDNKIQAKLFLSSDGVGLFLSNPENGIIQGILNSPNIYEQLKEKFPEAKFNYSREFKVSLKKVTRPKKNSVWLIGDAAHVQSPVGGQGLNLAVADAVIISKYLDNDELYAENKLAKQAKSTLFFTDFDYRMLATTNIIIRSIRNTYWHLASKFPWISGWFFKSISGINHYKFKKI